nr:hypothetical protein [uncultured Roseateles sp.]
MRPMTPAEIKKIEAIAFQRRVPRRPPVAHCHGEESDALFGSPRYERTIQNFGRFHHEVRANDLDKLHKHLLKSYPGRDITVRVCPEFDSYGILLFSVYGFTEADYLCSKEEKAFLRGLTPRMTALIGPVAVFRRTGPFPGRASPRSCSSDRRSS